jgi:hypothetical protein
MLKVLGTDTLVSGKFIVNIDQPIKAEAFMLELQGTGGGTTGPTILTSQMGRVTFRKRGDLIWDFDFKHMRWLNQYLFGQPYYSNTPAASSNHNLHIKIPCGLGDGNLMDVRPDDNAVFEFTINSSFPATIGASGWVAAPTWNLLAHVKEGVSAYDLKFLTPSESIGATQNKPVVLTYENIAGVWVFDATATDSDTGVGGTQPDMTQANHLNRIKARIGTLDADSTMREWLNETNWDGRLEANLTALAKIFAADQGGLSEALNDACEITYLNGSTALVVDMIVASLKMNPHKLSQTQGEQNVLLANRIAAKSALGQNWNVKVLETLAGAQA